MAQFLRPLSIILLLSVPATAQEEPPVDRTPSGLELPVPSVKLLEAGAPDAVRSRSFFGRIAARETVDLSFEVGGRLLDFPVIEGGPVVQGDLIARLELGAFERAVEQAELALAQANRALERAITLALNNAASAVQAEDATTARDLADVNLRESEEALADATLTAPFDGLVAARLTPQYTNVNAGQPILRLHDMSEVRVEIDVPERLVQTSDPDDIRFEGTLPQIAEPFPLEIAEFDAQTGTVGQTFRVSLRLPDLGSGLTTLIPGASMTVFARTDLASEAGLPLPATAILPGADRMSRVMIYEPEDGTDRGRVRAVPVDVVSTSGTDLRVDGLADGAQVVAVGGHLLSDGQVVRPYRGLTVEE